MIKTSIPYWVFRVFLLYATDYISFHGDPQHLDVTPLWKEGYMIIWSFWCDTCGQIWILWCYRCQFEDLRQTSWPAGQAVPVQWYNGLMFHVVYLVDILKILGISSKLVTFVTFYMTFSENSGKVNQIKFCANVQMDQFTLQSAVIRWNTYEYEFWIILWAATLSNFPGFPCAL